MGSPSAVAESLLRAHGTFSAASLPDLRAAAEGVELAALQLDLIVKRIRVRGGDPTIAVDIVAQATARLEGLARDLLASARALDGRT